MKVKVGFELDVNIPEWIGRDRGDPVHDFIDDFALRTLIANQVREHTEAMVRDHFYDQGWINEHHPNNHPARTDCTWCTA